MLLAASETSLYKILFINTLIKYIQTSFYTLKTSFIQKIRLYHLPVTAHIAQKLIYQSANQKSQDFKGKQVPSMPDKSCCCNLQEHYNYYFMYKCSLLNIVDWMSRLAMDILPESIKKEYVGQAFHHLENQYIYHTDIQNEIIRTEHFNQNNELYIILKQLNQNYWRKYCGAKSN